MHSILVKGLGATIAGLALQLSADVLSAAPWSFETPITVAEAAPGVFHQLSASGRRSLAVSDGRVALVWEDEHDGTPRVYAAVKDAGSAEFAQPRRLSGEGEAFEPAITGLSGGRFLVAWEEDGQVVARVLDADRTGAPKRLTSRGAQVSLASLAAPGLADGAAAVAVWADREAGPARVTLARLAAADDLSLQTTASCPVEDAPPTADQLYPSADWAGERLVVAWEDRRPGHTIIMAAIGAPEATCDFAPPTRISADPPGPEMPFGAGHGVARVALASYADDSLLAVWEDKRNFREGYDVYGARLVSGEREDLAFGPNERIQDDFGGLAAQWHVTASGHADGTLVVGWTDERDGQGDIALSWSEDEAWSDDLLVPVASGPAEQSHPTLVLDEAGDLHLAWVSREAKGAPTRLQYSRGQRPN
jgi:hypothetical protein